MPGPALIEFMHSQDWVTNFHPSATIHVPPFGTEFDVPRRAREIKLPSFQLNFVSARRTKRVSLPNFGTNIEGR